MATNRNFRTCPTTGLLFHEPAEKLMRWNAVVGVVCLLIGGLLARPFAGDDLFLYLYSIIAFGFWPICIPLAAVVAARAVRDALGAR